jgi:hypothetical protein
MAPNSSPGAAVGCIAKHDISDSPRPDVHVRSVRIALFHSVTPLHQSNADTRSQTRGGGACWKRVCAQQRSVAERNRGVGSSGVGIQAWPVRRHRTSDPTIWKQCTNAPDHTCKVGRCLSSKPHAGAVTQDRQLTAYERFPIFRAPCSRLRRASCIPPPPRVLRQPLRQTLRPKPRGLLGYASRCFPIRSHQACTKSKKRKIDAMHVKSHKSTAIDDQLATASLHLTPEPRTVSPHPSAGSRCKGHGHTATHKTYTQATGHGSGLPDASCCCCCCCLCCCW